MSSTIAAQAEKYPHILVDFFDTLIFRYVHPLEVGKIWAQRIHPFLGMSGDYEYLYAIRKETAQALYTTKQEPSYQEWMNALFVRLNNDNLITKKITFEYFLALALDIEERIEQQSQFPNSTVVEALKKLKTQGKKIYLVSDYHLPGSSVLKFLAALDLIDIFERIFVSADYNKTKRDATLYPLVLSELGINPDSAIMMGDNFVSDCKNSGKHGIASIHIKNKYNSPVRKAFNHLFKLGTTERNFHLAWKKYAGECWHSNYPFSEYVLVYFIFIERLFDSLKRQDIRDVIFLAREGYWLKQFFEIYQEKNIPENERLKTHYLKISRQAAAILTLKPLAEESFAHISDISIYDFLFGAGFSQAEIVLLQKKFSLDFSKVIEGFVASDTFRLLKEDINFREIYEAGIQRNKDAFGCYYRSLGIPQNDRPVGVVDVGWKGRMQDCLHALTGQATAGFYLGLREPSSLGPGKTKKGLIFSTIPCHSGYYDLLDVNRQIYEQLLIAPHGSAVSYALDAAGNSIVHEDHKDEEAVIYREAVAPVQTFMLALFQRLCGDVRLQAYQSDWVLREIARSTMKSGIFVNGRRLAFIRKISKGFVDNFGNVKVGLSYSPRTILNSKNLIAILRKPQKALRYIVKICTIPNTFRRRLLFGIIAVPYYFWFRSKP